MKAKLLIVTLVGALSVGNVHSLFVDKVSAADSRSDIIVKIEAQRKTIREHIAKYNKFKAEGSPTSTATTTISNSQAIIRKLIGKASGIPPSYEDSWVPD
jgi:hypothetical protein